MVTSEGQLFKSQVGDRWQHLSPNIQARFDTNPSHDTPLQYAGTMTKVECSGWGKLFAALLRPTGALLPYTGENIPVDIHVFTVAGRTDIFKRRTYFFPRRKPFLFKSNMRLGDQGEVLEFVGWGFGMKIIVSEKEGNLHFRDDGYFWQIGPFRIPLPDLLTPGKTYLVHSDMGPDTFRIVIRIEHLLFGLMYYQEGVFHHKKEA